MRSRNFSNTSQPTRPACPRCSKKGIGIWHAIETFRSRDCRYCGYTEFQTLVINEDDWRGDWRQTAADKERQASHNGQSHGN